MPAVTLMINLPACFRLRRVFALLVALGCATAAHAGHFSTTPWMNDASTYIVGGQSSWAYHFGSATTATVNGGSVAGVVGPTATNANFALTGTQFVFSDVNNLTALGGTGSAVIASNFVFGGAPATITVKNLTPGSPYTVSILSVGVEAPGARQVTFASGTDSRLVDQDQFGDNNGIRVDYTFTASGDFFIVENLVESSRPSGYHSIDVCHATHCFAC